MPVFTGMTQFIFISLCASALKVLKRKDCKDFAKDAEVFVLKIKNTLRSPCILLGVLRVKSI